MARMRHEARTTRKSHGRRYLSLSTLAEFCAIAAVLLSASASAQYFLSIPAGSQVPGIRYFGSAKDDQGVLLQGVTVVLSSKDSEYVFVTSDEGRFSADLPLNMTPDKVTAKCSLPKHQLMRVTMRPGPKGLKPTVQVDCVLRASSEG